MAVAAFAPDFDGAFSFLDFLDSVRLELSFLFIFGLVWCLCHVFGLSLRKTSSSGKSRTPLMAAHNRCTTASKSGVRAEGAGPARAARKSAPRPPGGSSSGNGEALTGLQNPSQEQLRDGSWVVAAVQQLCRVQVQRSLDLYQEALRAGLDLGELSPAQGAELFLALTTSTIRLGRPRETLQVLRECRRKGPGVSSALLASAIRMCTSKQFFKECLEICDFAAEDQSLIIEDRSVWSCLVL
jgi:hypothetical protein